MKDERMKELYGLSNVDDMVVEKSTPMLSTLTAKLTLDELKLVDIYLARINSRNPEARTVIFEKGEFERIMGYKRMNVSSVATKMTHLLQNVVKIPDATATNGMVIFSVFEKAHVEQEDGQWKITLMCTEAAKKYIFNIDTIGYLQYKLHNILAIKKYSSYSMYMYIEKHRNLGSWTVKLDNLKRFLGCENTKDFEQYKEFNRRVLKPAQLELREKAECVFTYEPIKKGRQVVSIRFVVQDACKEIEEAEDVSDEADPEAPETELWQSPLRLFNFTPEQYAELRAVLISIPHYKLPEAASAEEDSLEFRWYHYMNQKAHGIVRRDKEKHIRNKFAYLLKVMQQDMA